jgi:hypothetical protein
MSDKDTAHLLNELQEARAEIDRLREITVAQFEGKTILVKQIIKLEKKCIKAKEALQALNAENDALLAALEQSTDELLKLLNENQKLKQGGPLPGGE